MKEKKQKFYILFITGLAIFASTFFLLLNFVFHYSREERLEVKNLEIVNVKSQGVDIFWKGLGYEEGFDFLYKESTDTGLFREIEVKNVFEDITYENGNVYSVNLVSLKPNTDYIFELWSRDKKFTQGEFATLSIAEEILIPEPISGKASAFDWVKVYDENSAFLVMTDWNGSWVLDGNLLNEDYKAEVYASVILPEENIFSSSLISPIYASKQANCDEINYAGVDSQTRAAANHFANGFLSVNNPRGTNQYLRCYDDVYCESDKVGVNPLWSLANWAHESNASDYTMPNSINADFGVIPATGVPIENFQAQLGFFLNLSHDPCNCGSGCTKEEYYCCWGNNYLNGTRDRTCTDQIRRYLTSVAFYYYGVQNRIRPSSFDAIIAGFPNRIKTSGNSGLNCGPQDPIKIYRDIISGGGNGSNGSNGSNGGNERTGGICCALKITGRDDMIGDWEDITNMDCSQIWEIGRSVYGGKIEYSVEMPNLTSRSTCERWWSAVCCQDSGDYQWVPSSVCRNRVSGLNTYEACVNAEPDRPGICCALKITGRDDLRGDWENITDMDCDQIWEIGRSVYGGEIEYSVEMPEEKTRAACERWWDGVCCEDGDNYNWVPIRTCNRRVREYDTYESCIKAGGPREEIQMKLDSGYNFISWGVTDEENYTTASSLLNKEDIILIASFKDGIWEHIMYEKDGETLGVDFELERGNAYLIITSEAVSLNISGRKFYEFDWGDMKGWQFVPRQAFGRLSTMKDLIVSFEDVNIEQVGLWEQDIGLFSYFIHDTEGQEYGVSRRIYPQEGVFVKIK